MPSLQALFPLLLALSADGKCRAQAVLHASSCSRPALQHTEANQTGKGMCFSVPTAGLLEKILPAPADFITSLPEDPKVPGLRGEGSLEEAAGWLCWDTPLGLWLLATAWVTSLSKVNWWHLCDFPKALCCLLLPVRSLAEGFLLGLIALGEQVMKSRVYVMVLPGGLQLLRSQRGESDCWGRETSFRSHHQPGCLCGPWCEPAAAWKRNNVAAD